MSEKNFQIITFYEFKRLADLAATKAALEAAMRELSIRGTIIVAEEGYNSTVAGEPASIAR